MRRSISRGNGNIALGANAGAQLATGSGNNLILGNAVASTTLATGSNDIILGTGSNCDASSSSLSNIFLVCATTGSTPLLQGNLAAGSLALTDNGTFTVAGTTFASGADGALWTTNAAVPMVAGTFTYGIKSTQTIQMPASSAANPVAVGQYGVTTLTGNASNIATNNDALSADFETDAGIVSGTALSGTLPTSGGLQSAFVVNNAPGATFTNVRGFVFHMENNSADTITEMTYEDPVLTYNAGTIGALVINYCPNFESVPGGGSITTYDCIDDLDPKGNILTIAPFTIYSSTGQFAFNNTTPAALANGIGTFYGSAVPGAVYAGQGSSCDVTLANKGLNAALCIPTGTTNVNLNGLTRISNSTPLGNLFQLNLTSSPTTYPNALSYGVASNIVGASGGSATLVTDASFANTLSGTSSTDGQIFAVIASPTYSGTGTVQNITAFKGTDSITAAGTATIADLYAAQLTVGATSTVTNARLFDVLTPTITSGGAVGILSGVYIDALTQTGVTTAYAIDALGTSDITDIWGCYVGGAPTGGCEGAGTVNATLYNQNVAVTNAALFTTGQLGSLGLLPNIATNSILANVTSGSAAPTAFSMTSCSAPGSATTWTTNTGFGCQTGFALTANVPTLSGTNTFTGSNTFNDPVIITNTGSPTGAGVYLIAANAAPTTYANALGYGLSLALTGASGGSSTNVTAGNFSTTLSGTSSTDGMSQGIVSFAGYSGSGTSSLINGLKVTTSNSGAGTATTSIPIEALVTVGASAADTTVYEMLAQAPTITSGGTIATLYGVYIAAMTATGVTTPWALYAAGASDKSAIAGKLAVGSTSTPGATLTVTGNETISTTIEQIATSMAGAPGVEIGATNTGLYTTSAGANLGISVGGSNVLDCDITTASTCTSALAFTSAGLITGSAGLTVTGAAVNLNAASNFAISIGGTSDTSTIAIGNSSIGNVTITGNGATSTINGIEIGQTTPEPISSTTLSATGTTNLDTTGSATLTLGNSSATIIANTLGTDSGKTTRTLCQQTSNNALYFGSGTGGICAGTSTLASKSDFGPITMNLGALDDVPIGQWHYKPQYGDPKPLHVSPIAEDVAKAAPSLVYHDKNGKPTSFDMLGLLFAMQARDNQRFDSDDRKIRALERRVAILKFGAHEHHARHY
jgi:hypothetical protein